MRSKLIGQLTLRKIVGSILSSNLSDSEIIDFSHELMSNPEFGFELAHALKHSIRVLEEEPSLNFEPIASEPPWLAIVMDRIQKSKIPKREVISLLPQRDIGHISPVTQHKMSLRDLLLRAFENSSQARINAFIRKIGVESEPDPYLTGIEKKN